MSEWLTFLVSAGTLIVAVLALIAAEDTSDLKAAVANLSSVAKDARRQADAQQGQLDEMIRDRRPWMKETLSINSDLRFTANEGRITIRAIFTNVGKSVTTSVNPVMRFVLQTEPSDPSEEQAALCNPLRKITPEQGSRTTVFPGDFTGEDMNLPIDLKNEKAALAIYSGNAVNIFLIGCVDYLFEGIHHQTGFMYRLNTSRELTPTSGHLIDPRAGDVAASDMVLWSPYGEGSYID